MSKGSQRGVQTRRLHRDLLARAAKLDGIKPAEWGRRVLERLRAEDFVEESGEEMERFDRLRHGEP